MSYGDRFRVSHTSCCAQYEWACEGGHFLVLRAKPGGGYEETGRGPYRKAIEVYIALAERHRAAHLDRGEVPEPDRLLWAEGGRRG